MTIVCACALVHVPHANVKLEPWQSMCVAYALFGLALFIMPSIADLPGFWL